MYRGYTKMKKVIKMPTELKVLLGGMNGVKKSDYRKAIIGAIISSKFDYKRKKGKSDE